LHSKIKYKIKRTKPNSQKMEKLIYVSTAIQVLNRSEDV